MKLSLQFLIILFSNLLLHSNILFAATYEIKIHDSALIKIEDSSIAPNNEEIIAHVMFTEPDLTPQKRRFLLELGLGYLFPAGLSLETRAALLKNANQREIIVTKLQIISNLRFTTAPTNSLGLAVQFPITKHWSLGPIYKLWMHKNYLLDPDYTMYLHGGGLDSDISFKPLKNSDFKVSLQGQVTMSDFKGLDLFAFHGGIVLRIPLTKKNTSSRRIP